MKYDKEEIEAINYNFDRVLETLDEEGIVCNKYQAGSFYAEMSNQDKLRKGNFKYIKIDYGVMGVSTTGGKGSKIGRMIKEIFEMYGFIINWDGSYQSAIWVTGWGES